MKILVLCGGTSTEREISLVSGSRIAMALKESGHTLALLDVFIGHENIDIDNFYSKDFDIDSELEYIKEHSEDIKTKKKNRRSFFGPNVLKMCKACDIVFLGLHGACGEDGRIQAAFDLMGIKYTGCDYISSAMAMNKAVTRKIFKSSGVPIADGFSIKRGEKIPYPEDMDMTYPVIVKACCGGSSIGVYFVDNRTQYEHAVMEAFKLDDEIIVEKRIIGREFSVGVVNYEPYPVIEIIPDGVYDYENKYNGKTKDVCPALISDELRDKIQLAAKKAAMSLGLDTYCRIDVLTDMQENVYCLEANTLPGMTPTSLLPQEAKVLGYDFGTLCDHLIAISLNKYENK